MDNVKIHHTSIKAVSMGSESWNVSVRPVDVHEVDVVCLEAPELSLHITVTAASGVGRQQW